MLMPKRVKYRKQQRGRKTGISKGNVEIEIGEFALQAVEPAWVTSRQIEAVRRVIVRGGKLGIRFSPEKPVPAKPAETRMGSGKGSVDHWVAVVKPGRVMFEVSGVPAEVAKVALSQAAYKLPMKTQVIGKQE